MKAREAIAPLVANRSGSCDRFAARPLASANPTPSARANLADGLRGYSFEDSDRAAKRRHSQSRSAGRADFDFTIDRLAAIGEKMNILLG
jgi:hypothetical protein